MTEHRQKCTHMTLKDINLIQSQLQQHQATHGQFTIEVAKQELLLNETHVKLADLLRTSKRGTNLEESEFHHRQAFHGEARLEPHISERKTSPALQLTDSPGSRAPWTR